MDVIIRLLLLSLCGSAASAPLSRLFQRRRDAYEVYAREYSREYEPYMFAAIPLHAPVPVLRVLSRAPLLTRARDAHAQPSAHHVAYARPGPEPTRLYSHVQQYAEPALQYAQPEPTPQYPVPTRPYVKPARPSAAAEHEYEASSFDYSREYAHPTYYQKPRRQVQVASPTYEYATEYASYVPQLQSIQPSPLPQLTYAIAPYDSVAYSATQEGAPTVLYARPSPSGGFTYRRVPNESAAPKKKTPAPLKDKVKEKEKDPPFIIKIHKYRIVKDDLI